MIKLQNFENYKILKAPKFSKIPKFDDIKGIKLQNFIKSKILKL